jgi:hypothetical protein
MARRSGKAVRRRSRQRSVPRGAAARPQPATPAPAAERAAVESTPAVAARTAEKTEKAAPSPSPYVAGASRLSERARDEYHYVARDLRNIGVLVLIIAVLLGVAVFAFNALGLA